MIRFLPRLDSCWSPQRSSSCLKLGQGRPSTVKHARHKPLQLRARVACYSEEQDKSPVMCYRIDVSADRPHATSNRPDFRTTGVNPVSAGQSTRSRNAALTKGFLSEIRGGSQKTKLLPEDRLESYTDGMWRRHPVCCQPYFPSARNHSHMHEVA